MLTTFADVLLIATRQQPVHRLPATPVHPQPDECSDKRHRRRWFGLVGLHL